MTFLALDGTTISTVQNYPIFAGSKPIRPGQAYAEPEGEGFVFAPAAPETRPAARVQVALTSFAAGPAE